MTAAVALRYWFIGLYVLGFVAFAVMFFRLRSRRDAIEKKKGPLPTPGILVPLGLPLLILLIRFGELQGELMPLRYLGVGLSLYFLVMLPWMMRTLGRFAIPGVGVFRDHELITTGPYGIVRHPLASAAVALWLAAGLGTANWVLLALWPVFVVIVMVAPIRQEEELLRDKFGGEYEKYARETPRLVPKMW